MERVLGLDMSQPIRLIVTDGTNKYRVAFDVASFEHVREADAPPEVLQCGMDYSDMQYNHGCSLTFCQAGCLICSYDSVAQWAGYSDDPVEFASYLRSAGAFGSGQGGKVCEIARPHNITKAYPMLIWHNRGDEVFYSPRYDAYETSYINWEERPGDRVLVSTLLKMFPVAAKVDYKPKTRPIDQHFVVLYDYIPDPTGGLKDDCRMMCPMVGYGRLSHYFNPAWWDTGWMQANDVSVVERALLGLRVLHPTSEGVYD